MQIRTTHISSVVQRSLHVLVGGFILNVKLNIVVVHICIFSCNFIYFKLTNHDSSSCKSVLACFNKMRFEQLISVTNK